MSLNKAVAGTEIGFLADVLADNVDYRLLVTLSDWTITVTTAARDRRVLYSDSLTERLRI